MSGYSPAHLLLVWPPAWEAQANAEGWTLREAGGCLEVDLWPARSDATTPIYHHLVMWLVLNAYVSHDPMHLVAWECDYAANKAIYDAERVPGDSMILVTNAETGQTFWREWPFDDQPAEWPR